MLLLLQKIFLEVPVLMLLYVILDHLYGCFLAGPGFRHNLSLNSHSLWSSLGWFTKRNFSEGPALSIGPFQKVQREVIYNSYVVRKNEKSPLIVQKL